MSKQFTPCPACGAVGEVNSSCQFCGTTILLKEGVISSTERIPKRRTVTPREYAEKISIYNKVEPMEENLLKVSIGKQYGLINLNGDLILPLQEHDIDSVFGNTVDFANKTKKGYCYYNLTTATYADYYGFIEDSENTDKLYRVDVKNNWVPNNTYMNLAGKVHSYDYAERIIIPKYQGIREYLYLLHQNDECSLWIPYTWKDESYMKVSAIIPDNFANSAKKGDFKIPMCVLEGIQEIYDFEKHDEIVHIILKTINGTDISLALNCRNINIRDCRFDEIFKEWCIATGNRIDKITYKVDGEYYSFALKYPEKECETVSNIVNKSVLKNTSSRQNLFSPESAVGAFIIVFIICTAIILLSVAFGLWDT